MKLSRTIVLLLSALLLSGCSKPSDNAMPVATSTSVAHSSSETPSAPTTETASPASELTVTPAAPPVASFHLNLAELAELPVGVSRVADQKGRADQALSFTGESSKVELPWDINPEKHPQLTITAWARFTGDVEGRAQYQVLSHDDGDYDRGVGIDSRAGEWGWSAFAGEAGVIGGIPLVANEWVFLAVSYDQAQGRSALLVGETEVPAQEGKLGSGHPYVWVGGNPSFGEHFVGDIAHVQVYDRILSSQELEAVREQ